EIRGVNPVFKSLGGDPLMAYDEWCCSVDCERGIANIRLSWNVKPLQSLMLVQGTTGVMRVDFFHMFVAVRKNRPVPTAAVRVLNTLSDSVRPLWEMPRNTALFLLGKRRQYQGIHGFITDFYRRLSHNQTPSVTLQDARAVVRWTEAVARESER